MESVIDFMLAYLDAGSGALLAQLLIGGAAGVAAFLKFRWRSLTGKSSISDSGEASESDLVASTNEEKSAAVVTPD